MAKKDRSTGFTLLELIIVIVLLALIAAIVSPRLTQRAESASERGQVRKMLAFLRSAKESAITRGETVSVRVDVEGRMAMESRSPIDPEVSQEIDSISPPSGYTLSDRTLAGRSVGGDDLVIEFYPDGTTTGGTVTFTMRDAVETLVIAVDGRSGSIRATRGAGEPNSEPTRWRAGELERRT